MSKVQASSKYQQRKIVNRIALSLAMIAMAFGLFWLLWILWEITILGVQGLSLAVFTQMTPPPNDVGGLANAIYGSAIMVGLATLIGTPIGIMAGIYLAEYGQKTILGEVTRFINDILLSAPSIVIGLFIYTLVVIRFKSFSALAGVMAAPICQGSPRGCPGSGRHHQDGHGGQAG